MSEDGPAIEVNSHDRFLIELRGQNIISSSNGNAAISMGTLQSEDWGGGTISIVGLEENTSLTIPAVEGIDNGIYLGTFFIQIISNPFLFIYSWRWDVNIFHV